VPLLNGSDPDPFAVAVRSAVLAKGRRQLIRLLVQLGDDPLPPRLAGWLGRYSGLPSEFAARVLRAACAAHPDDCHLLMTAAEHLSDTAPPGMSDRAIGLYRAAVAAQPRYSQARMRLGEELMKARDFPGAAAVFRHATRLDPDDYFAHFRLGLARLAAGNSGGAADAFRDAGRRNDREGLAHLAIGFVLARTGDTAGAVEAFREAVRRDHRAVYGVGQWLENALGGSDYAAAAKVLRAAVRAAPTDAQLHWLTGMLLREAGAHADAVSYLQAAIEVDPAREYFHYDLGNVLMDVRQYGPAAEAFRAAARLDPRNVYIHLSVANALVAKGDNDAAIAALRDGLKHDPQSTVLTTRLDLLTKADGGPDQTANALMERLDLLEHELNELQDSHGRSAAVYAELAEELLLHDRPGEALGSCRKALADDRTRCGPSRPGRRCGAAPARGRTCPRKRSGRRPASRRSTG
jgi:tetratricopeptide (TPR) repeat protein